MLCIEEGVPMGKSVEIELARDEIIRLINEGSTERRGMSANDLLNLYRKGKLDEPGEVADLLALADLLPDDDNIFEP